VSSDVGGAVQRIAFVTPEFLTEPQASGGIANYVAKMATALSTRGVDVEVFVPSAGSGTLEYHGVRVERVPTERSIVARALTRVVGWVVGPRSGFIINLMNARRLAAAVERRHGERPFDAIQSSNHNLSGAFLRRTKGRVHVVRLSTSRRLYDAPGGRRHAWMGRMVELFDVRLMRRADVVYAPSTFLAEHFNRTYGLDVRVVRPPAELGGTPATADPAPLPTRYLVHFGSLGSRKGTDSVAAALTGVWEREPGLQMVWVGPIAQQALDAFRTAWGARSEQVLVLGLLEKAKLYRVLQGAVASVLPSRIDNLPNTVIESLALGIPVIGSDGASIDELVEHGVSGWLVPIGDVDALAEAMVVAWRGEADWLGSGFVPPARLQEMRPDRAVQAFLELVARTKTEVGE